MYVPQAFAMDDLDQIRSFVDSHSFATLVTSTAGRSVATHIPLMYDATVGAQGVLLGHLARANEQWRSGDAEGLAIFTGPHAYISPGYYQSSNTVPTWNYVAVHVYGRVTFFDDDESLRDILRRLVDKYERPRAAPWPWEESAEYATRMLREIVGLRLTIERIEAKWKLNQNHPAERRRRVIAALEALGGDANQAVASLMRETLD